MFLLFLNFFSIFKDLHVFQIRFRNVFPSQPRHSATGHHSNYRWNGEEIDGWDQIGKYCFVLIRIVWFFTLMETYHQGNDFLGNERNHLITIYRSRHRGTESSSHIVKPASLFLSNAFTFTVERAIQPMAMRRFGNLSAFQQPLRMYRGRNESGP